MRVNVLFLLKKLNKCYKINFWNENNMCRRKMENVIVVLIMFEGFNCVNFKVEE